VQDTTSQLANLCDQPANSSDQPANSSDQLYVWVRCWGHNDLYNNWTLKAEMPKFRYVHLSGLPQGHHAIMLVLPTRCHVPDHCCPECMLAAVTWEIDATWTLGYLSIESQERMDDSSVSCVYWRSRRQHRWQLQGCKI